MQRERKFGCPKVEN